MNRHAITEPKHLGKDLVVEHKVVNNASGHIPAPGCRKRERISSRALKFEKKVCRSLGPFS